MSPQFVDFDGDGHLDIVAATYDGSPHLVRGSAKGFLAPAHILDAKGERILLNQFWNYDTKKWENATRCDPPGAAVPKGHCTSAVTFDWDGDGDLDLLLGDHEGGRVYLRLNEGKPGAPAFTGVNVPVLAAGSPLQVAGELGTLRLVDWDRDGATDLMVSSFGDSYGNGAGGAVYLYRNESKSGAPRFAAPIVLIVPSDKKAAGPVRPDSGLYPDVADVDGDGDLDLVVGGYSQWMPEQRQLSAEEKERVLDLRRQMREVEAEQRTLTDAMTKATAGQAEDAAARTRSAFLTEHKEDFATLGKRRQKVQQQLDPLVATQQRVAFVWLYENTTTTRKVAASKEL